MTRETAQRDTRRSSDIAAMIAAFQRDPPLQDSFPLKLSNGVTVPQFTVKCSKCRQPVDADMVHGRVLDSLPRVKTLIANACCEKCQGIIPVNGRFREVESGFQFEFRDGNGRWCVARKPKSLMRSLNALAAKLTSFRSFGR